MLGYKGPLMKVGNSIWGSEWSRDWWRHM